MGGYVAGVHGRKIVIADAPMLMKHLGPGLKYLAEREKCFI